MSFFVMDMHQSLIFVVQFNNIQLQMSNKNWKTVREIEKMDQFCENMQVKYNFWCECGKKYDNYPALYLHFKRYHKMKISTRVSEQHCKVIKTKDSRAFIYYCNEKNIREIIRQEQKPIKISAFSSLQTVIQQFSKLEKLRMTSQIILTCILEELIKFMKSYKQSKNMVEDLPICFNEFMEVNGYFFKQIHIYEQGCLVLLNLAQWLNQKKYSKYIIELNKIEPTDLNQTQNNKQI